MAWLELAAGGAAWLAHVAWYVGRRKRSVALSPAAPIVPRSWWPVLPWLAGLLLLVSWSSWVGAHGASLGSCATLAALTAAASVDSLVTPLAPRLLFVLGGVALGAALVGLTGWLVHA